MKEIVVGGISYELDKDGFLDETSDWDVDVAISLAKKEGLANPIKLLYKID